VGPGRTSLIIPHDSTLKSFGEVIGVSVNLVLPDSNYLPALVAQHPTDSAIADYIGRNFYPPESTVSAWLHEVSWASMPEAAIYENDCLVAIEDQIWLTRKRVV
jgi:hypothetical protein